MSILHLDKLLNPTSVVVVGASARESSPGLALVSNLLDGGYQGELQLVNPRYKTVLGQSCYKSLAALPSVPELALILTPTRLLRKTLVQCARKGIKVAIVMSGMPDAKALHRYARRLGLRLLGPYCAGLIRPHLGLNATYSANRIDAGSLAIITQSASFGAALVDWAEATSVGFSALLSTGADTDIRLADLLDLLAEDRHTKAIIVFLNRVHGSRALLSALSATARIKPVVLMKSTQDGARYCDALTHTGQVYSSDRVFQAALARAGVVRIRTFSNLFAAAKILASELRTQGKRLAIVSNGAAPAMLACERIESKGFKSPLLCSALGAQLKKQLGKDFSGNNPIVLRDLSQLEAHYPIAITTLRDSGAFDAVLAIYVPDSRNDPTDIARAVLSLPDSSIPLLTCWMGEASVGESRQAFADAGVASFRTPEAATESFDFLHRYFVSQQQLLQLPNPASRHTRADVSSARELVWQELANGTRVMGPQKTRRILSLFDIDVLPAARAESLEQALVVAQRIGFPVVMKLVSPNIAYKATVVRTQLNIDNQQQLHDAWSKIKQRLSERRPDAEFRGVLIEKMHRWENARSLAVSISRDAGFGPVLTVGIGGDLTALVQMRSVQLPPLNNFLIDDLLSNSELAVYMGEFRHCPAVGTAAISHALRQLSELACELPEVFSLDINPLVVSDTQAIALDAQVVIEKPSTQQRYSHLAIHPYPWQWVRQVSLKQNHKIKLRPIRPEDGESIRMLIREMSPESRFFRFMHAINELSPKMLAQFTKLDYDRQMAFVAVAEDGSIIGVSRYTIDNNQQHGEFAISVGDQWQGIGVASALMRLLIEHAESRELVSLHGDVLRTNTAMHRLMKSQGFNGSLNKDDPEVLIYRLKLPATEPGLQNTKE
ncbi:MAG: GNAT family N-acetyltransferase [Granulosicoccus sp.]